MPTASADEATAALKFETFRAANAPKLEDTGASRSDMSAEIAAMVSKHIVSRLEDRGETRFLFGNERFSLVYAWFKSGYPVILHSHDTNCLYYIVGGSLKLGNQIYGKGDGFFVPGDVPYTYVAGPEGVEVLEFRDANNFTTKVTTSSERYWERTGVAIEGRLEAWRGEEKPTAVA